MGTTKRKLPAAVAGGPQERHKRAQRPQHGPLAPVPLPGGLVARPALPIPKSKHHSYFEFVENKDKKKKLNFEHTFNRTPPPDFEFVAAGNPQLTAACKELSRENGVMIFIVTNSYNTTALSYANQLNRVGFHFHTNIVQEARASIVGSPEQPARVPHGVPEPIPKSQRLYHAQADAVLRDLFPRIPNTDRQRVLERAFTFGTCFRGQKTVGLSDDIPLSRRAQLAVLAHIRHTHTRYDQLLRETDYQNARRAVESLSLDILVKWRGDEETGRDQLDEILREVVVISDSEDDDSEEETEGTSVEELDSTRDAAVSRQSSHQPPHRTGLKRQRSAKAATRAPKSKAAAGGKDQDHGASRSHRRGFKRYRAWEEALQRNRDPDLNPPHPTADTPLEQPNANSFPNAYDQQPLFSSVGSAPSSNGYVPQRTAMFQQLPHNVVPIAPAHTLQGEVTFATRGALQQQPTSVGNHFQDMLLPSIESAHPAPARPSSFPAVPPVRTEDHMDHSSLRHGMQYHHGQPPSLTQLPGRDDYNSGPRVISDHMSHGRVGLGGFRAEESLQAFGQRDLNQFNSDYHGNPGPPSLPHSAVRVHEATPSSDQAVADRIVLNAARPGSRLNPILMEDRGGFYERVAAQPEPVVPPREPNGHVDDRRLVHQVPQAPDRHIVVSQEEGSRILQESQGTFGVEIIPIPRSGTIPHLAHPHSIHVASRVPLNPWERGAHVDFERSRIFGEDCGPGLRPPSGEYRAPPPQPYREELHFDFRLDLPPQAQHEPGYQQHQERPPMGGHYYDNYGREHPSRVPQPEHVNVFR
ncbi:hypothetical protein TOPH_00850 [Tolypocladium ophioglossoides CBS 100239]|uniref:DUF2293 domain-containing protein n=1 Tax=Tolypocladium ophioglossoides (strain CBS 100239) TaxID=1163406 RepID=A0A0L0NKG4_TOLOC|nr:hypothetical protein TOPH_00850 [Tolypocladium ophioglossoides CBS 100239]